MKNTKIAVLLSALMLTACAGSGGNPGQASSDIPRSGYLNDYTMLTKVPGDYNGEALRWISPNLVKGKYKKIIIHPVTYYPMPKEGGQIKQENLDKISAYLTQQLSKEVSKSYELTNTPGSDTLDFKLAVTGVATSLEGLQVYEVIPVALVLAGASTALGYRDKVVTIAVEGIVTDSMTNEVIAKGLRQGVGENLSDDKQQLQIEQVKALFDEWAKVAGTLAAQLK
ncbi:DUF3313 domain-containing protein [Aeromonas veronii]|uniref:DUF3313 domain-containing protein n=1 Tax=Aeromonas veronii TaxID=654 RepID=UPI0038D28061